jgi:hypothetical protein
MNVWESEWEKIFVKRKYIGVLCCKSGAYCKLYGLTRC